jgi:hypothetical protein
MWRKVWLLVLLLAACNLEGRPPVRDDLPVGEYRITQVATYPLGQKK